MAGKKKSDWPIGQRIVAIRPMTKAEAEAEGWERSSRYPTPVLVLDDGAVIYASQDGEGNGPGALFFNNDGVTGGWA